MSGFFERHLRRPEGARAHDADPPRRPPPDDAPDRVDGKPPGGHPETREGPDGRSSGPRRSLPPRADAAAAVADCRGAGLVRGPQSLCRTERNRF